MTTLRLSPTQSAANVLPGAAARPPEDAIASLARAAAAGDLRMASRLLEALAPRIASVVRVVMGRGHPDADDVVQQSLIAFLQALPAFRGECHPSSYASRIAVRTAVAARRRSRLAHSREGAELEEADRHESGTSPSPGDEAVAELRKRILRDLLAELPEEQAESLALRVVLGWSLDEVATATQAPLNTVRSRIRLAKEALRRRIEADPRLLDGLEVEP
jgi:RNA polymerase sigma-70 factor (ECF subfamily)